MRSDFLSAVYDGRLSYHPVKGSRFKHAVLPGSSLTLCMATLDTPVGVWRHRPTCRRCMTVWNLSPIVPMTAKPVDGS